MPAGRSLSRPLIGVAALAGSLFAATPAAASQGGLFSLFRQVCLEGGATLPRGLLQPARFGELPRQARVVLGMLHPGFANERPHPRMTDRNPIAERHVPNRIYRLSAPEQAFLLLPDDSAGAGGTAGHCVLLWRGRHYAEVTRALHQWLGQPDRPVPSAAMPENVGWAGTSYGDQLLAAASYGDWTLLTASATAGEGRE